MPTIEPPTEEFQRFEQNFAAILTREIASARERLSKVRNNLEQEKEETLSGLDKSRERIASLFADPEQASDLKKAAQEIDSQLTWINRKLRPGLDREVRSLAPRKRPLVGIIDTLQDRFVEIFTQLPETPSIAAVTSSRPPAQDWLRKILAALALSPRRLARELLPDDPQLHPLIIRYKRLHDETLGHLADNWRGLRFHFEIVIDEMQRIADAEEAQPKIPEELSAQILDALDNSRTLLAKTTEPLLTFYDEFPGAIESEYRLWLENLREELLQTGSLPLALRHTLIRLKRPTLLWREKGVKLLDQGREEVSRTTSSGLHQTGNFLRNLQDLVGGGDSTNAALYPYFDLPSSAEVLEKSADLPAFYRRLFTLGPLRNREFLVAREDEMEALSEVIERWRQNKVCNSAIIGPEGSGKTSLLNCFASEFGAEEEIVRIDLKRRISTLQAFTELLATHLEIADPVSVDALTGELLAGPRRIIVFEGAHLLASRTIDGALPLTAFLTLMTNTRRHLLWIVTFRNYPFVRLDYLFGLNALFTHTIRTLFHDEAELRETILMRHRTSGLTLSFDPASQEKPVDGNQGELKDRYFRELFAATSGNIDAALYHWLRSLRSDPETKALHVATLDRPDPRVLRALSRDQLFALGEVIAHGGLTVTEHASLFCNARQESETVLEFLLQLNLLRCEPDSEEGEERFYQLNPVFFGPVSTLLESMNILY